MQPENTAIDGQASCALGGKYLTFALADENYAIEIMRVREIIGLPEITAVPRMPACVVGVFNLRGKVVPAVDLGALLGKSASSWAESRCVIVADVGMPVGVIVDHVQDVLDFDGGQIEPPPAIGTGVDAGFIRGLGAVGDGVRILLDIERVLAGVISTDL